MVKGILESDGSALLESTIKARAGSRAEVGGRPKVDREEKGKMRKKTQRWQWVEGMGCLCPSDRPTWARGGTLNSHRVAAVAGRGILHV